MFERLAHALTMAGRERVGREAGPTGRILDAQGARRAGSAWQASAATIRPGAWSGASGTHSPTPTAAVSPANLHDSPGGVALLRASRGLWPFLKHCFADRAYRGERVGSATAITVVPKEDQKGFAVQPRRWVIERTFG